MRLIDAEKTIETLKKLLYETALNNSGEASMMCEDIAEHRLKTWVDLVPTEAEPIRHGRWLYRVYREYNSLTSRELTSIAFYKCSVCGHSSGVDIDNYCPHCGAKMDQEQEGEQWVD